jgi:hypothetical protein
MWLIKRATRRSRAKHHALAICMRWRCARGVFPCSDAPFHLSLCMHMQLPLLHVSFSFTTRAVWLRTSKAKANEMHPDVPHLLNNLGAVHRALGRDLHRAFELALRASQLSELCAQPDRDAQLVSSFNNVGNIENNRFNLDAAIAFYRKGLFVLERQEEEKKQQAQAQAHVTAPTSGAAAAEQPGAAAATAAAAAAAASEEARLRPLLNLGDTLLRVGNAAEAGACLEAAWRIVSAMRAREPERNGQLFAWAADYYGNYRRVAGAWRTWRAQLEWGRLARLRHPGVFQPLTCFRIRSRLFSQCLNTQHELLLLCMLMLAQAVSRLRGRRWACRWRCTGSSTQTRATRTLAAY